MVTSNVREQTVMRIIQVKQEEEQSKGQLITPEKISNLTYLIMH